MPIRENIMQLDIEKIQDGQGAIVTIRSENLDAGDPARLIADSTRARELLGWVPRYPALRDIVADAWRFASRHVVPSVTGQRSAA